MMDGVGVLLEIARQLSANPIGTGVDIVLFDTEDYGDYGVNDLSAWVRNIGVKTCTHRGDKADNDICWTWSVRPMRYFFRS